jgi:hypothetical protein
MQRAEVASGNPIYTRLYASIRGAMMRGSAAQPGGPPRRSGATADSSPRGPRTKHEPNTLPLPTDHSPLPPCLLAFRPPAPFPPSMRTKQRAPLRRCGRAQIERRVRAHDRAPIDRVGPALDAPCVRVRACESKGAIARARAHPSRRRPWRRGRAGDAAASCCRRTCLARERRAIRTSGRAGAAGTLGALCGYPLVEPPARSNRSERSAHICAGTGCFAHITQLAPRRMVARLRRTHSCCA